MLAKLNRIWSLRGSREENILNFIPITQTLTRFKVRLKNCFRKWRLEIEGYLGYSANLLADSMRKAAAGEDYHLWS